MTVVSLGCVFGSYLLKILKLIYFFKKWLFFAHVVFYLYMFLFKVFFLQLCPFAAMGNCKDGDRYINTTLTLKPSSKTIQTMTCNILKLCSGDEPYSQIH